MRGVQSPEQRGVGGATVEVDNVVKSFGTTHALRGVSLSVAVSEFVTITGPSGSGKSTLLNLIGSLERPDSGMIAVAGEPVPEPSEAVEFRRQMVGFVFQDSLLLPYVDAQTNQVRRALILDAQGNRNRFDFETPAVNLPVQNGEFDFVPPPGTKIIKP